MDNCLEQFCVGGEQFISLNFLIVTGQEGFLFYTTADKLQVRIEQLFNENHQILIP